MSRVHINGKWLAQPVTGTQRYAAEMVGAIMSMNRLELVVHLPSGVGVPKSMVRHGVRIRRAPVSGVLFEQFYLPVATAGELLLNFAGPAPLLKRRQLVTMHDATPFRYPSTFSRVFVAFYALMYWVLGRDSAATAHRIAVQRDRVGARPAHPSEPFHRGGLCCRRVVRGRA